MTRIKSLGTTAPIFSPWDQKWHPGGEIPIQTLLLLPQLVAILEPFNSPGHLWLLPEIGAYARVTGITRLWFDLIYEVRGTSGGQVVWPGGPAR